MAGRSYSHENAIRRGVGIAGRALLGAVLVKGLQAEPTAKSRVVISAWDSLAQIEGWLNCAKYKEDAKIGDKYATFRLFAIGGAAQRHRSARRFSSKSRAEAWAGSRGGGRFLRPCVQPSIYGALQPAGV